MLRPPTRNGLAADVCPDHGIRCHRSGTRESFAAARNRLAPGGVFDCLFACERQWVADRTRRAVAEAFGQEPLTFLVPTGAGGPVGTVFVAGDLEAVRRQVDASPALAAAMSKWAAEYPLDLPGTTEVATDDWPYIYLESRQIPILYLVMAGLLVAQFARGWRQLPASARRITWGRSGWHFFFLGAAFMLLEVQNVSKAAVLLGSTWQVNAVVVVGVLGLSLVANAMVSMIPRIPLTPVYLLLVGACGGLYFLDLGSLAGLPYAGRVAVVGGVLCFPVLFSGVAFARSFAGAEQREAAFGANLIGALAGGLLQAVTFVTGTQALLLIVAGLYVAAWATRVSLRSSSTISQLPDDSNGSFWSRTGPGVGVGSN